MVDQDIFMFEGTIRENLTMWDPTIAEMDIVQAAKDAAIHRDIANRAGGYEYKVEEGGRNFSGGQRQRLGIARAPVGNPTTLLLDQATPAPDPITQKAIYYRLRAPACAPPTAAPPFCTIP